VETEQLRIGEQSIDTAVGIRLLSTANIPKKTKPVTEESSHRFAFTPTDSGCTWSPNCACADYRNPAR